MNFEYILARLPYEVLDYMILGEDPELRKICYESLNLVCKSMNKYVVESGRALIMMGGDKSLYCTIINTPLEILKKVAPIYQIDFTSMRNLCRDGKYDYSIDYNTTVLCIDLGEPNVNNLLMAYKNEIMKYESIIIDNIDAWYIDTVDRWLEIDISIVKQIIEKSKKLRRYARLDPTSRPYAAYYISSFYPSLFRILYYCDDLSRGIWLAGLESNSNPGNIEGIDLRGYIEYCIDFLPVHEIVCRIRSMNLRHIMDSTIMSLLYSNTSKKSQEVINGLISSAHLNGDDIDESILRHKEYIDQLQHNRSDYDEKYAYLYGRMLTLGYDDEKISKMDIPSMEYLVSVEGQRAEALAKREAERRMKKEQQLAEQYGDDEYSDEDLAQSVANSLKNVECQGKAYSSNGESDIAEMDITDDSSDDDVNYVEIDISEIPYDCVIDVESELAIERAFNGMND
jgi:hypothetical protein